MKGAETVPRMGVSREAEPERVVRTEGSVEELDLLEDASLEWRMTMRYTMKHKRYDR